jgi:hypothetical protein
MTPQSMAFFAMGMEERDIIDMLEKCILEYKKKGELARILPACSLLMNKCVINEKGLEYLLQSIKSAEDAGRPATRVNLN